jgi:5-methylcytosine-specific restriction endonuclease McrA
MALPGSRRSRCRECQSAWDRERNARPSRKAYVRRWYAAGSPRGQACAIGIEGICTGEATTWDHIVPLSQGGTDHYSNMRPACRPCNSALAHWAGFRGY